MELKLNSPITEEQWDMITDVNMEHTNSVTFKTKNGSEVTFYKAVNNGDAISRQAAIDAEDSK